MIVRDVMTKAARTCAATAPLTEAVRILWDHDCGVVPVVDAGGRPIGMVTDRDACMAAYTSGARLDELPVHAAMAKVVFDVRDDAPVAVALASMREHQVRRLPVVDSSDRLVGVVSLADCVRCAAATPAELVGALGAVCAPRTPVAAANGSQVAGREPTAVLTPPPASAAGAGKSTRTPATADRSAVGKAPAGKSAAPAKAAGKSRSRTKKK